MRVAATRKEGVGTNEGEEGTKVVATGQAAQKGKPKGLSRKERRKTCLLAAGQTRHQVAALGLHALAALLHVLLEALGIQGHSVEVLLAQTLLPPKPTTRIRATALLLCASV